MTSRSRIDDVARMAGVSPRTVSRVINGLPNVSQKARLAIEEAIAALDFQPNFAARTLASSRSFFIGVIGPQIRSDFFSGLHAALVSACRERGMHPVIEQVSGDGEAVVDQVRRIAREVPFAGMILISMAGDLEAVAAFAKSANIVLVEISSGNAVPGIKAIRADEMQGEVLLAEHFWSLSHRRFAIGKITADHFSRGAMFREHLLKLGAQPDDIVDYPIDWALPGLEAGRRLGADILSAADRPTALFALNDEVGVGAVGHFLSAGLDVPGQISVAGFDDSPMAQAIWPALTTIRQPVEAMAREAVAWLLDKECDDASDVRTLPVDLVVRGSSSDCSRG